MSARILVPEFEAELELDVCPTCQGTGNSVGWDRTSKKHVEDKNYPCERCKGAKFIVVPHWKKEA